ncbi:rRNA maturation RNase YbeY [Flavobacterium psychrophilum]|uniref:Endoribonuclease YbeY n=2 Tax=Flavobacterium psychrophilum TaxID=96345 RepID=YBEY_FLAPJ|nr:rRNA maturation RNase YbeY [Flavobacterium psychrophilum]A6GVJ9.1 RecName: Full=Endoribonuclease YbeY [Flavobacterium psychrophilum JIP02/86]AIG31223.1 rRNA maturation factor [Flavobacterium psychrophilum]AIG33500.1 rRNA maturation factor [Flavobacterium psychrophilum]AIG35651.1 rRNA maturation factor [Flavobacterium psychrophilum]AIG38011.1 rRNA maturation factor [Flavobacterium psychrophilum]AIG40282.1 rRNA maturation factor [Flavobacterium psychrophilum]
MISFNYEIDFEIREETSYINWVSSVILSENKSEGEINYIFCDDNYLLEINQQYLNHDTLTDVISFDYSLGDEIHGDIYISIERVRENADDFKVPFEEELKRVMIHGVLHYCGYKDKSDADELLMRSKEDEKLKLFHVKQN